MDRRYWARRIGELDPATDFHEIYRILIAHEFPWDMSQSLGFALYRTYAVPSIGRLLRQTGELTQHTQRRYDDTVLILDTMLEHGLSSEAGRTALRRMNQMHGAYDISNDDKLYVLCTFVVVPVRWLDRYGWRRLTEAERTASANYYRELGKHMGIKGIPGTYQEFAGFLDRYEEEYFGFDQAGLAVSEATLRLMATFPPNHLAPRALVDRFAKAMMDDRLLTAFGYQRPARWERAAASGAVRLRAAVVRFLPPRKEPRYGRQLRNVRSYPHGYDVAKLGTFPGEAPAGDALAAEGGRPDLQERAVAGSQEESGLSTDPR